MKHLLPFSVAFALGCGTPPASPPAPAPAPVETPPATSAASSAPEVAPAEAPAPTPEVAPGPAPGPAADEVDLLHAVPARISVSSAYHDDATQIARIADGDLTTAWNSRTGDLVGSWIELEVPADASVRAIAMTVGFTRTTDRSDLFVGNHRVARVRVSRDGVALGEHDLDTENRGLVEVPVNGPGGVLRIEVLRAIPGTHSDWREICVSEVRVLGSAPGASAGTRTPVTSVGATTDPTAAGSDEEDEAEDAEELALEEEQEASVALESCASLLGEWGSYTVRLHRPYGESFRMSDRERTELEQQQQRHQTLFTHAAELFADTPANASDARTRAAASDSLWSQRAEDLEALIRGCGAVMAAHPSQTCEWAELRAYTRLEEIVDLADEVALALESNVEMRENEEGLPLRGEALEAERAALAAAQAFEQWLERIHASDWDELRHRQRATLLSGDVPPGRVESEWTRLRADVESAETACASGD